MAKLTKNEISEELNEMLDTSIPWEKLPRDSLVELKKMFENPEIVLKNILRYQTGIGKGDLVFSAIEKSDRPIVGMIRNLFGGQKTED